MRVVGRWWNKLRHHGMAFWLADGWLRYRPSSCEPFNFIGWPDDAAELQNGGFTGLYVENDVLRLTAVDGSLWELRFDPGDFEATSRLMLLERSV